MAAEGEGETAYHEQLRQAATAVRSLQDNVDPTMADWTAFLQTSGGFLPKRHNTGRGAGARTMSQRAGSPCGPAAMPRVMSYLVPS